MAQRIQTLFIDDLDGSEAEGTVRFGLDGVDYEIDLNFRHAEELRGTLAPYTEHGRRASNVRARPAPAGGRSRKGTNEGRREYLRLLGHDVNERGRIPAHLLTIPIPPREQWPTAAAAAVPPPAAENVAQEAASADELAARAVDAILPPADLPKRGGHNKIDQGVREKALRLVSEGGSISQVAQGQGVAESTLRNWVRAARAAEAQKATKTGRGKSAR